MADDVSNGELYRLMLSHGEVLKEIKSDVKEQNGRVNKLESRVQSFEADSKTIDSLGRRVHKLENDSIRIKTLWTAGVSFGAIAWMVAWDWLKRKLGF